MLCFPPQHYSGFPRVGNTQLSLPDHSLETGVRAYPSADSRRWQARATSTGHLACTSRARA
jgi:hypothetical protein